MHLYENFNTTNQTEPRYEAHENFVADIKTPGCSLVNTIPYEDQCAYVENEEFCVPEYQLFNYLHFFYCVLSPSGHFSELYSIVILILILSFQFLILGKVADEYFCPALTMVSKMLGMSETLAGVTLLAFGNGAPDVFTSLASLSTSTHIGLQYGELIGAATFITGVVSGSIIVVKQFQVYPTICARDYLYMIFSILYIDTILYSGHIVTVAESIGCIIIYIVYITIVCVDQYLLRKSEKELEKKEQELAAKGDFYEITSTTPSYDKESAYIISKKTSLASVRSQPREIGIMSQFLESINPVDLENWKKSGYCGKFCIIIQIPLIILRLTIPIANFDEELNGWTKLLNCFHFLIFLPLFIYLVLEEVFDILTITTVSIFILAMLPFTCMIFFTSKTNQEPKYHGIYAIIGACICVGYISYVATEIISVLLVLGTVLKANSSFLGCTLLAWGNSIGDLVTNIALAKQGYHRMGFAACIGGPLFNILIGCGITFIYKAIHNPGTNTLSSGALSTTSTIFLLIILSFTLFSFVLTEFQARRSIGFFLIFLYILCFAFSIGSTVEFFHPYGTDHSEEAGF